jgi:Flp pilus assembly protein TadD
MNDLSLLLNQAVNVHRKGDLIVADGLYSQILKARPDDFDAQHFLGVLRCQQGRFAEALFLIGGALKTKPNSPTALLHYAVVLDALMHRDEALATYDKVLLIEPNNTEALNNRGNALRELNRLTDARSSYGKALAILS